MTRTFRLIEVLQRTEMFFPMRDIDLPNSLVYTNEADYDPIWADHIVSVAYKARTANIASVVFGQLPSGTLLCGGHHCLLRRYGRFAEESLPHVFRLNPSLLEEELAKSSFTIGNEVSEECVLLARWGYGTWGHWLGEIVPMAAMVERRYPGRFRYAVPDHGVESYRTMMRASLSAYGIDEARFLPIPMDKPSVLIKTLVVTPIWSDHSPHPAALDVMRSAVELAPCIGGFEKVALMRRDWSTRGIANGEEIEEFLISQGFAISDTATLAFLDQVRLFQSANTIFSVLGSGLTGLIYAPNKVGVVAAGPASWGDRFFYALGQHRSARWAEVRGLSHWDGQGLKRDAPFEVPLAALRAALTHL